MVRVMRLKSCLSSALARVFSGHETVISTLRGSSAFKIFLAAVGAFLFLGNFETQAANKFWLITSTGTQSFQLTGNWSGGTPTIGDDVFITNVTTFTVITNRNTNITINSLTMSNNSTAATILILSNMVFDATTKTDRKSTRLNSSHERLSRMPSSA